MRNDSSLGATYLGAGQTRFVVWAPRARSVTVQLKAPVERRQMLTPDERGYHHGVVEGVEPGCLYFHELEVEGRGAMLRPDPASRHQPRGVHGPSAVVNPTFAWSDGAWRGIPLERHVFYELHVGTFTSEGTFEAVVPHLERLRNLGVTAIEILPVAQFPGNRNWGYDGVFLFAAQNSYGGPLGLKHLVDACHQHGLAVILDVVYNHLGPEGNYLGDFAPYFTNRYKTPWGSALNFDDTDCDEVRRYFIENALYWIRDCRIDGLRLDAVHAIYDASAYHFLEELADRVRETARSSGRLVHLIAESDLNAPHLIRPGDLGGYGLDAQWSDDFHHALHTLQTREVDGYYADFGKLQHLERAFRDGYVYAGQYSEYRRRRHGRPAPDVSPRRFVVCAQNHDQVGNRMLGERLTTLVPFEELRLAAGCVILSPYLPLLFMGEEYGEPAPFQYFVSHSDEQLINAVRRGRREEFQAFAWKGEAPDPQAEETYLRSKLHQELWRDGHHATLHAYYSELLRLRREVPALARLERDPAAMTLLERDEVLLVRRGDGDSEALVLFCFAHAKRKTSLPLAAGKWSVALDSADRRWGGNGTRLPAILMADGTCELELSPRAVVLLVRCSGPGVEP